MKFSTAAIHAGYHSDPTTRAAAVPVYQTTSYTFDDSQHGADLFNLAVAGNIYTRIMNPTNAVLEARVAALEGGVGALALASGMTAITYALQALCSPGSNIVSTSQLYGGTYNLFAHSLPNQGIQCRFVDHDDLDALEAAIDDNTRALYCESIGNPAGNVVDLKRWAEVAERHGVPLIVDNTVATPYLCRPFEHGAHIVVHSLTKYIGGHGTTIGGAIVDSGRFDWKKHARRFPIFSQPDPSYHGVVYTDSFGEAAYIARCRNTRIDAADSFALVTFTQPLGAREAAEIVGFAGSGGSGVGRVSAVVPYENAPVALPEPVAGATREDVFRRWAGDAPIAGLIVYTNGSAKEKIRSDQRVMCVESLPADAAWGKFGIKPVL